MNSEIKTCQNCKANFTIEPEDFDFYKKIEVPPPTFCPDCRLQRRLVWRNERSLYRRRCDLCQKAIVNRFPADTPFPVYCHNCWISDRWDPLQYGAEYDFSRPFFAQFMDLYNRTPQPATFQVNAVNSDYCVTGIDMKNAYLSASVISSEDVYYSYRVDKSRNVFDVAYVYQLENCYQVINGEACFGVAFGQYIEECLNSWFLYDTSNSQNCVGCVNLRNAKNRILNQEYSPEEWKRRVQELDFGSYKNLEKFKEEFKKFSLGFPRRAVYIEQCLNVIGNNVFSSKNCQFCFDSYSMENSKYVLAGMDGIKDSYDMVFGGLNSELCYEASSCKGNRCKFGVGIWGQDNEYCQACLNYGSSNLFGCVSLAGKYQYCILNKQHTPEEYKALVTKIKRHMDEMPYRDERGSVYAYGESFPASLSPFAYNETLAQEYFPLTKEEVITRGYEWKDSEVKNVVITKEADQLPDHIKEVEDSILNEVIGCGHKGVCSDQCATAFRITAEELEMHRRVGLSLPRLCGNCRHYERMRQRNPITLYDRQCECGKQGSKKNIYTNTTKHAHGGSPCANSFKTTYAPDRPEIVYCEQCYQSEVV